MDIRMVTIIDAPFDHNKPTVFINVIGGLFITKNGRKILFPENMELVHPNVGTTINELRTQGYQIIFYHVGKTNPPLKGGVNTLLGQVRDKILEFGPGIMYISTNSSTLFKKYKQKHSASFVIGTGLKSGLFENRDEENEIPLIFRDSNYDKRSALILNSQIYYPHEIYPEFTLNSLPPVKNPIFIFVCIDRRYIEVYIKHYLHRLRELYPDLLTHYTSVDAFRLIHGDEYDVEFPVLIMDNITEPYGLPIGVRDRLCILYSYFSLEHHPTNISWIGAATLYLNRIG